MNKKLVDSVLKHYYAKVETETTKKMRKAIHHEMTCGDLSHGHGTIKVEWNPAKSKIKEK
jgi:hypothetical protein